MRGLWAQVGTCSDSRDLLAVHWNLKVSSQRGRKVALRTLVFWTCPSTLKITYGSAWRGAAAARERAGFGAASGQALGWVARRGVSLRSSGVSD